jgi:hypothetical protein
MTACCCSLHVGSEVNMASSTVLHQLPKAVDQGQSLV